ncbi:MAG: DUF6786 family protein [Promethearchaeia archaeon]
MKNYFTKKELVENLNGITNFVELNLGDDGCVIISEYGGRPLGFFPLENRISLLWINQKLCEIIAARDRLIGGDRYWISPEREFFYKDPKNWKDWFCPPELDPANYEILGKSEKSCTLSTPIIITNMFSKEKYRGEITRQFTVIKEPIKTGLPYIALEFIDDCIFFRPDLKINGWTLANVISGGPKNPGTVLIPTKENPKPLSYFRTIPENRLFIGDNFVAFKIDVDDIYKLAIRPEDINFERKAKIGYILKMPDNNDDYCFLVKLSDDIPKTQKECRDIARDHPDSEIGVIQSYNSDSPEKPLLKYGEIELQLSMFQTIDNASHGKAIHYLIGYIGSRDEIFNAVEKYLGISEPYLF